MQKITYLTNLLDEFAPYLKTAMLEKKHLEESRKRYVLVMSRTRLRVNPHSIVAWMSRNSLLEVNATELEPRNT